MEKIVVIRRNGLGDFIAGTVPVCNFLQNKYGECEFHFFMSEINFELVKYFFPKAHVYCIPKGNKYIQTLKTALKNRHIKARTGFSPMPDYPKLCSIFLYAIGTKYRYGRKTSSIFTKLFNKAYINSIKNINCKHVGLCTINFFDKDIQEIDRDFYPKFGKEMIKKHIPKNEGIQIMVEVSNNRPPSQLSITNTVKILNSTFKKYTFCVLITAKKKDFNKANELKKLLKMPTEIYVTDNIHDFISFVDAAEIVLCGDGGLGHIAGALGKKVVALYAVTSIIHWGILGFDVIYLYDNENVNNIESEKIINALKSFLE